MNDKRIVALLTRRAAGELSAEELSELQALLSSHPDSVYYEEFVRELWHSGHGEEEYSSDYFLRHKQRHSAELDFPEPEVSRHKNRWFKPVLCGLAIVLVSSLCWWFLRATAMTDTSGQIEIVAERGVRKQIKLPDGTKVWLNGESRLIYDGTLENGNTRTVRLEGEAFFDVMRNVNRPFIITTDKISVKVLGTTFNVKAYPSEERAEATLITGEIELSVNDRPKEKILMKPNEKVEVVDRSLGAGGISGDERRLTLTIGSLSKVQVADKEYIRETSWVDNKLVLKDETLEEIVPKLERWYDVDISLRNPRVKGYRYTATLTEERIDDVLSAMQLIKSFHFKVDSNDVIIY